MTFRIKFKKKFRKDLKKLKKQSKDFRKFKTVTKKITNGIELEEKYHLHKLKGNYSDHWECHIQPDWLLIYLINGDELTFVRTGSHSELFDK